LPADLGVATGGRHHPRAVGRPVLHAVLIGNTEALPCRAIGVDSERLVDPLLAGLVVTALTDDDLFAVR
jgi:hypothetical protein